MKTSCKLLALVTLSLSSATMGATNRPFLPSKKINKMPPSSSYSLRTLTEDVTDLIPRGGASLPSGPFDAETAQKVFIYSYGPNAILCTLFTKLALRAYGLPQDPATERLVQASGAIGWNTALLYYLQVFQGMSFDKALGWSVFPFILTSVYQALIAKSDAAIGFPSQNHILSCGMNLLVFLASQTSPDWASKLYIFYGAWSLINSVPMMFCPNEAAKVWKITIKSEPESMLLRTVGYFLLAHALAVLPQAMEKGDLGASVGWAALSLFVSLVGLIVTGKFDDANIPKDRVAPWLVLLGAIANSLLNTAKSTPVDVIKEATGM